MATAPTIEDKAQKPAGLLPKNVQSWLLAGLAVLMVLIRWLTGAKKPPAPVKPLPAAPRSFQFHIIFIGINPLLANSFVRTKESVREIRHVYLDLDEDAAASMRAIRTGADTPMSNFVLDTSAGTNRVIGRVDGLERERAESFLHSLSAALRTCVTDRSDVEVCCILIWSRGKAGETASFRQQQRCCSLLCLVVW